MDFSRSPSVFQVCYIWPFFRLTLSAPVPASTARGHSRVRTRNTQDHFLVRKSCFHFWKDAVEDVDQESFQRLMGGNGRVTRVCMAQSWEHNTLTQVFAHCSLFLCWMWLILSRRRHSHSHPHTCFLRRPELHRSTEWDCKVAFCWFQHTKHPHQELYHLKQVVPLNLTEEAWRLGAQINYSIIILCHFREDTEQLFLCVCAWS